MIDEMMTRGTTMHLPSFRVDGKTALITGASRGIGLAAAHALAQAGARVVLAARNEGDLNSALAAIQENGGSGAVWPVDITDSAAVSEGVAAFGPFDIVVNNAGTNRPALLTETRDQDLHDVLDLNIKSVFYVCREVIRQMQAHGISGSIINISSQMGHVGGPRRTVYCATKHAIEGLTKALAWEVGSSSIRVNTLCPTFIETEMTRGMLEEKAFYDFITSKIALGRIGRLEDIMGPVVFLASDASALMTGSALMVDGGWTAE